MLRLESLQAEFPYPGIRKPGVARRSVAERFIDDKPRCRQFPHIVKHRFVFIDEYAVHIFRKVFAVYTCLRNAFECRPCPVANVHDARLSQTMMHKYSAGGRHAREANPDCAFCERRISHLCEKLTMIGALVLVPSYLCLLFAMAVPSVPGDALRFLLLSLCFVFLGAGVAFFAAADIVRGR